VEGVWTYTQPRTGVRLHARKIDYSTTADYYKGTPEEGCRSFVYSDHLDGNEIVELRNELEHDVHATLDVPFKAGRPALMYEHSMSQSLPEFILRKRAAEARWDSRFIQRCFI